MKNKFLIYLTGNIFYGFSQWVIILILVKQGLMTELGVYSYAVALIGPIYLFYSFGLNTLVVTTNSENKQEYLSHRVLSSFLMMLTFIIIALVVSNIDKEYSILLLSVALVKIVDGLLDVNFSYHIKHQRQHLIGIVKIFMAISLMVLTVFFTLVIDELYLAFFIYSIIFYIYFLILNKNDRLIKFDFKKYKEICLVGLPISLTLLASSLNTNVPRYLLEIFGTIELVGIFSSLLIVYSAGNTLFFSIYNFILPRFVQNKELKSYVIGMLKKIIILGTCLIIVGQFIYLIISEELITILYTKEFLKYQFHLNIVFVSSGLIYMGILLDVFINGYEKYKYNTIIQIINLITIIIVGLIVIPKYLLLGAVISFMAFGIMNFLLKIILTVNILRRKFYA